jgi:hypothetical protein
MTTPGDLFVLELSRASRKAMRFVRHLQRADRDDVISAALLWCWENRESYSLTTSLDTWFVNAVRHEYDRWRRGEKRNAAKTLESIPTGDTTLAGAEALEAATKLATALPRAYRRVALLDAQGYTRAEMMAKGLPHDQIYEARARIKQLRRLVPEDQDYRRLLIRRKAPSSDEHYNNPSNIDHQIQQLEAMPKHGADCPPCWKCKWFEGRLPGKHRRVGMKIQEKDVAAAVAATEARKIEIAKAIRSTEE